MHNVSLILKWRSW